MAGKISLPHQSIVVQWKEEKVIKWLKRVHLEDCIPAFEIRHIDGAKLLELTEQRLFTYQDLKIKHRKQIAKCVQECKSQATSAKRIARSMKNNNRSDNAAGESNGACDSEDSDEWGTDFEDDSEDEVKNETLAAELNNNTIIHSPTGNGSLHVKSIPKPPDIPVISKSISVPSGLKNSNVASTIPRPPLKRPPSQPPPPPVSQTSSHDESLEEYEIPIVSSNSGDSKDISEPSQNVTFNESSVIETYELIEPPEENYEIVDAPTSSEIISEKPQLPPRQPLSSGTASPPPPLPQKPKKLIDNIGMNGKSEEIRTFTRMKLPAKNEDLLPDVVQSSSVSSNISFISSLIGRRSSTTSSPKSEKKVKECNEVSTFATTVSQNGGQPCLLSVEKDSLIVSSETKKVLPPLPPRSALSSEDTVQNMATRPLPPVPVLKEEKPKQDILLHPWYHEIEREVAEQVVRDLNESGSFVVRPSKRAGKENPYSLTVFHEGKMFHLNIRLRPDNSFALGKEKRKEKTFPTVAELIAFHQTEPILLTSRGESAGKTILSKYPEKT